jgi:hypothetical protein
LPWLSNIIDQQSASDGVYIHPRQSWQWLSLRDCDVVNLFEGGKYVQVLDGICVCIGFTMLSRFNASEHAASTQRLLAWNLKVFGMV